MFGGLIAKNAGIYTVFQIQENVEGTKHCKIVVFWQLLDAETLVFMQLFARNGAKSL